MNIKLLSLNEENENFECTGWRHNMFQGFKKEGGATIRGIRFLFFLFFFCRIPDLTYFTRYKEKGLAEHITFLPVLGSTDSRTDWAVRTSLRHIIWQEKGKEQQPPVRAVRRPRKSRGRENT